MSTKFVLTCAARTGSTMINSSLRRHPDIVMHGEVFGDDRYLHLFGVDYRTDPPLDDAPRKWRDRDPIEFLRDVVFDAGTRSAVGLKFKYEELSLRRWALLRDELAADRSIHIIHLHRANLLERYLSQYKAVHLTGVYNVQGNGELPEDPIVDLDPLACEADFRAVTERRAFYSQLFVGHPTFELSYEALNGDVQETYRSPQDFLSVEAVELPVTTQRLKRRHPQDSIRNFDELRSHFAGTEFADLFAIDVPAHSCPDGDRPASE